MHIYTCECAHVVLKKSLFLVSAINVGLFSPLKSRVCHGDGAVSRPRPCATQGSGLRGCNRGLSRSSQLKAAAEEPWVNAAGPHGGSPEETPLTSTGTNGGRQRRTSAVPRHQLEGPNYASLMMDTTGKNKLYKDIEYVKSCSL